MINWVLFCLALAAAAFGAAEQIALVKTPAPPLVFVVAAGLIALVLALRLAPLKTRRALVFLITFVALAGLTGGLAYFQFVFKPAMMKGILAQAFAPKPTAVAVEAAKLETWPPQIDAIGTLRAYQGVLLAPQAAGDVTSIHFDSGAEAPEGALLLTIDDSVEQADLANGLAQLRNADLTLDRARQLVVNHNTPQSTVDAALAARDSAAATVQHTRAVIAQKAIHAPFAGRLGLRTVDIGQYVGVGTPLVALQRLDPIYVDFPVPEDALATLGIGAELTMTLDALPGQTFSGRVKAVDARVSAESRNVTLRAEVPNPGHKMLPGMFAKVTVNAGAPREVTTLPRTAIVYSLYGDTVFVVNPAGPGLIAERRFVRLGQARGERVEITEGVKAGERVVTAGQIKLVANAPVTIDEGGALPPPAKTPVQ